MDIEQILGRRDGPVPNTWVVVGRVAAGVAFLCVATSDWVPRAMGVLSGLDGLGPLVVLSPLLTVTAWVLSGVAAAVVVLLGVHRPGLATGLALVPLVPAVLLGTPLPFATVAVLAGITVAAAWLHPWGAVTATTAALTAVLVWVVLQVPMLAPFGGYVELQYTDGAGVAVAYAVVLLGVLAAALVGRVVLGRSLDRGRRLAARSAEVEEQSEVTAERARLARDLHDVVAHHVSLVAVRAETAPYTHPGLGAEARSVLAEIAADARRALDELRGVLGILGRSVGEARLPQPSWGDIAALVQRSSSSGQPVELVGDVGSEVGPTVGYVAYRVVQEGLTNARKHAPGAPVSVRLERTAHLAVVTVVSSGAVPAASPAPATSTPPDTGTGSSEETAPIVGLFRADPTARTADPDGTARTLPVAGHGLVGMRERVEALGGRLVAASRDGGFVVEATLPLVHGERPVIRVVVADDQPVICAGFAALLDAQPGMEVVGTAPDGQALVDLARCTTPDLALVDVRMPRLDGIEATRVLTAELSTRVLVLTTFDLDSYVYEAIRAGASGFLLKDVTAERLVQGVRLVAEGAMLLGPAVTRRLVDDFAARGAARSPADLAPLSPRERDVLMGLARGRSNAEIAAELVVATETVKSHVAEVLRKLGLRDRIQAVVWAYEHGLVQPGA